MSRLDSVLEKLRRLLHEAALEIETGSQGHEGGFRPHLDVFTQHEEIEIQVEVPGMRVSELELRLAPTRLILKGTKQIEPPTREGQPHHHRMERMQGSFEREVRLPGSLDLSRAEAKLENGLLKIVLPLLEERRCQLRNLAISEAGEPSS